METVIRLLASTLAALLALGAGLWLAFHAYLLHMAEASDNTVSLWLFSGFFLIFVAGWIARDAAYQE